MITVQATETVGPTRLQLLTAGSVKLPVVIVAQRAATATYHVFDVASLQAAMTNQLSATPIAEAIVLTGHDPVPAVARGDAAAAPIGSPVIDNGRLIGVTASEEPERPEPTEQDLAKANANFTASAPDDSGGRKRGLWQRLKGSSA
ncbi:MAG: hypothetical protein ABJD68_14490 [Nakamurella sp.]